MESIFARAFKSSCFSSEVAIRSANFTPLASGDDFPFPVPVVDDFSVDEFFDLNRLSEEEELELEEDELELELELEEDEEASSSSSSLSPSSHDQIDVFSFPGEDMKELELWSHLMDDTISDAIIACPARTGSTKPGPVIEKRVDTKPVFVGAARFPPPIPAKTRSKRPRTASDAWSKSDYFLFEPGFSFERAVQGTGLGGAGKTRRVYVKKQKRNPVLLGNDGLVQLRRCTHCQVQKTPQWRTGPLGPKTLCNACGVRFKSGRLFPEYRPACSPTFSSEVHSNSHRKVLEMRKNVCEEFGPGLVQQF